MSLAIRPIGYSNSYQQLTVPSSIAGPVTAYLWGGGGGGGGGPDAYGPSGAGGGSGYAKVIFNVAEGDVIGIGVGGGGAVGATAAAGYGGGRGGNGYTTSLSWSSLSLLTQPGVVRNTNGAYVSFLNTYGVWNTNIYSGYFNRSTVVNFPQTALYTIVGSCDNYGYVYIDDYLVLNIGDFHNTYSTSLIVSAGNHTIRVEGINTGGPAAIGVTINGVSECYSGATGGNPGSSGSSGAGGGSGAATVLLLNGNIIGVAGGGGGGGGAARFSTIPECSAPGQISFADGEHAGQNGQSLDGDGGGAGAGGGGYRAGQGGLVRGYEQTGYGGTYGTSYSVNGEALDPSGTTPAGTSSPYWLPTVGFGGRLGSTTQTPTSGGNGYAVFEFTQRNASIKNAGSWSSINSVYIKQSGAWKQIKGAWTKQNGTWVSLFGGNNNVPSFITVPGRFGYEPRSEYIPPAPPPPEFYY